MRLGWEAAERESPQTVEIELTLRWPSLPLACATDDLAATVDYAALTDRAREVCDRGEYRLLERLAGSLYDALRPVISSGVALAVTVTKHPPLPGLEGGASFTIDDAPPSVGPHG